VGRGGNGQNLEKIKKVKVVTSREIVAKKREEYLYDDLGAGVGGFWGEGRGEEENSNDSKEKRG